MLPPQSKILYKKIGDYVIVDKLQSTEVHFVQEKTLSSLSYPVLLNLHPDINADIQSHLIT